jgi:hypothetical protein
MAAFLEKANQMWADVAAVAGDENLHEIVTSFS